MHFKSKALPSIAYLMPFLHKKTYTFIHLMGHFDGHLSPASLEGQSQAPSTLLVVPSSHTLLYNVSTLFSPSPLHCFTIIYHIASFPGAVIPALATAFFPPLKTIHSIPLQYPPSSQCLPICTSCFLSSSLSFIRQIVIGVYMYQPMSQLSVY